MDAGDLIVPSSSDIIVGGCHAPVMTFTGHLIRKQDIDMDKLTLAATETAAPLALPGAAWDLVSFLNNAQAYLMVAGGALITLIGLVLVVWSVVYIAKKFLGGNNGQQDSWIKIVVMLLIGGALMTGGIVLITSIAAGGKATIDDLGSGLILLQSGLGLAA